MVFNRKNLVNELVEEIPVLSDEQDTISLLKLLEENNIKVAFNGYSDLRYQGNNELINKISLASQYPIVKPYIVPYEYSGYRSLNLDNLAKYAEFLNVRFNVPAALNWIVCNKEGLLRIDNNLCESEDGRISLVFRIDFEKPVITVKPTKEFEEKYKPAFGIVRVIYGTVYFHINQGEGAVRELPGKWNILAFR